MDKKISKNRLYGYALRFGNDEVDVGTSGTKLDKILLVYLFMEQSFLMMMKNLMKVLLETNKALY